MLKKIDNKYISPLLFILIAASTTNLLAPAWGETGPLNLEGADSPPPTGEVRPSDLETNNSKGELKQAGENIIAAESELPDASQPAVREEAGQETPATEETLPNQPPTGEEPEDTGETAPGPEEQPADSPQPPTPESQPPEGLQIQPRDTGEGTPASEPRVLVAEVAVTGADEQLETLVYNTIRTKPGRTANRSQLQEDVNAIYATGFFANVKVTPEDTPLGVRVTFAVQPNPIFKEVVIEAVPATEKKPILPPKVVEETFGEQYGKILNLRELQEGIRKIDEWYSQNGFDLAQITGAPKVSEDGTVTLVIAEGVVEQVQVRFFDAEDEPVKGLTRDFIVTREMRLKSGDVFNRFLAQQDLQRVFGLGLFEDVRLSFSPGTNPQEVIVNVDVVEGNTGSVAAGAGFSSSAGLFGTVSYQQQNLGGNNQIISTELQLGERELLFDASFTDPWIATDPYRTSYTVSGFRRRSISLVYDGDNTSIKTAEGITPTIDGFTTIPGSSPRVVRTGGGVIFSRPLAKDVFSRPDWRLSAGVSYQNVRLENSDGDLRPFSSALINYLGQYYGPQQLAFNRSGVDDLLILSFIASQDFRNNPLQPTRGSVLRLGLEQTVPLSSSSGITFSRLRGNYSYYIPVNWIDLGSFLSIFGVQEEPDKPKPQALAFNIQGGTVLGDLPPYEAFILGGSNSVRGYAEGEVGNGRSYLQATAEYRFPIISSVGMAIFFDYGTAISSERAVIGSPSVVRGLPGWGYGYGIGVRIQSPVGAIRVDYGINNDGDSRVHFGIGERF